MADYRSKLQLMYGNAGIKQANAVDETLDAINKKETAKEAEAPKAVEAKPESASPVEDFDVLSFDEHIVEAEKKEEVPVEKPAKKTAKTIKKAEEAPKKTVKEPAKTEEEPKEQELYYYTSKPGRPKKWNEPYTRMTIVMSTDMRDKVETASTFYGGSFTDYVTALIEKDLEENLDLYNKQKELIQKFNRKSK